MNNSHKTTKRLLAGLMLALVAGQLVWADVPGRINFQGKLLDTNKNPRNGNYNLTFRLCDTLAASCASPLWNETQSNVPVSNGVFSVQLGNSTPITPSVMAGSSVFLEIQIGAEVASPRERLATSPYAFHASMADSLSPGDTNYIQSRSSLQSGSSFYVQAGTVNANLQVSGVITAGSTPHQITTSAGLLNATKLSGTIPSDNVQGTYSNSLTLNNSGNTLSGNGAGITNVIASGILPGDTDYIQNRVTHQVGAGLYVSSATVGGSFTATGTVNLGGVAGTNDVNVNSNLSIGGDLRVNGNDIADSGGTNRLTIGSNISVNGTLTVPSGLGVMVSTGIVFNGTANGDNYIAYPFSAAGAISEKSVVIISGLNTVNTTAAAASPAVVGITINASASAGDTVYVAMSGIITGVTANGAVTIGAAVCTSVSAGRVDDACNANLAPIGKALSGAAAAGDKISVALFQGR